MVEVEDSGGGGGVEILVWREVWLVWTLTLGEIWE